MIFGVIILALVAGIAFFHYVQGLFSAMVSATLVVLAALIAVSYHERLAESLFAGTFPSYAHAVALVGLFGLSYVLMRLVTDRLVPGNVRLPVIVDKIGAGAFGFIAGIFGAGILALAAQMIPMGPDIAGYSRFPVADREVNSVSVTGKYQKQDVTIAGELKNNTMQPGQSSGMFPIPADDVTLGLVSYVSNGGSLAGERSLISVHPNYADELFGHRLGPMYGADVTMGIGANAGVAVEVAYSDERVLAKREDFELLNIRGDRTPEFVTPQDAIPVVVRTVLDPPAATGPNALNTASVRLVINGTNYYPMGSFQRGEVMLLTRLDDYLFIEGRNPVDFVFMVESERLPSKENSNQRMFPRGSFIEARRAGRVDLSGMTIGSSIPGGSGKVGIVEKDRASQR